MKMKSSVAIIRILPVFLAVALFSPIAYAWNAKGHMVIARLAWLKLSSEERDAAFEILKKHPHFNEYLADDRPDNIDKKQWAFLRASTWSDWIKSHHSSEFSHRKWHYINLPYVPPGSSVDPDDHPPPSVNVVKQIGISKAFVKSGNNEQRAIHLCWLVHLIGDIRQPLHCVALYSEDFPTGDRGGNRALVKIGTSDSHKKLHSFWDGRLGSSTTLSSIGGTASQINEMIEADPDLIEDDIDDHETSQSWAEEGLRDAAKHVYLEGALKPANSDDDPTDEEVPRVPDDYAANAGKIARNNAARAGEQLAEMVRELLEDN